MNHLLKTGLLSVSMLLWGIQASTFALAADERVLKVAPQESAELWIAAERRELFRSLNYEATQEGAWVEIVRGRLEGLGPVTAQSIAASLSVAVTNIERALLALQAEGFAMRGRFTAAATNRSLSKS